MDLSKGSAEGEAPVLWTTEDYCILPAAEELGYLLLNRNTGQVELEIDQEPSALMALMLLQDTYDEVMANPLEYYMKRKDMLHAMFARSVADDEDFTIN